MADAQTILTTAISIANDQSDNVTTSVNLANGIAGGSIQGVFPSNTDIVDPLTGTTLTDPSVGSTWGTTTVWSDFDRIYNMLETIATSTLASFLTAYFPNVPSLPTWLEDAIANNGDIFTSVEDKYWAKARNQIAAETQHELNVLDARTSGRGFPLPPGARTGAMTEILIAQNHKLAEVSQQAAIKHIDVALEAVKLAVTNAVQYRQIAFDAAIKYIHALMEPADIATKAILPLNNYKASYLSALADYYRAQLVRDELRIRADVEGKKLDLGYAQLGIQVMQVDQSTRVQAAEAAAEAAAKVAMGAMSAMNAIGAVTETV